MIAIVSHPYHRGGATQWLCSLIEYLNANDLPCMFVTFEPSRISSERPLMSSLIPKGTKMVITKTTAYFDFLPVAIKAKKIYEVINSTVPKGSTLIPSDDESYWLAVGMTTGYKKLGILHGDDSFYYACAKKFSENFSGYIAVSRRILQNLRSCLDCAIIPCGNDLHDINLFANKEDIILFVGRLDERSKRISDLIPIMDGFLSHNPSYEFRIFGDGPDSHILDSAIKNSPHQLQIKRLSWASRDKILEQMAISKILLQTSNFEGMSLSAIEALACGNQIVSTKVSGIEDCNIDTVHLFDIGDISSAITLLEKAITIDSKRASEISVNYYRSTFDIPIIASKYIKFINNISTNNKPYIDPITDIGISTSIRLNLVAICKYLVSLSTTFRFW